MGAWTARARVWIAISTMASSAWAWAGASANGAEGGTAPVTQVTLPYDASRSRVWLPGRLNGTGPHEFLLDTGYDLTMIHPKFVAPLALQQAGGVWILGIAGRERADYYRGAVFDFEGLPFSPRRVASLPSERDRRRPRDGILGSGFFQRFVVAIDPAAGQVRLHEPERFHYGGSGDVLTLRFDGDTPVMEAVILESGREPVMASFEIDTGCDGGLCLGRDFVATNEWLLAAGATREGFRRGVGGGARTVSGRVPEFRMGSARLQGVSAEFFKEGSPAGKGHAGHAGWEVFRKFKVIFDYPRSRVILEPFAPLDGKK
jgi:hypothetical protein